VFEAPFHVAGALGELGEDRSVDALHVGDSVHRSMPSDAETPGQLGA